MRFMSHLITALVSVTGLAASAHAADRGALEERPASSRQITPSFLDGIVPQIATSAVALPVPKAKAMRKLQPLPERVSDPIGRIISLRTGNG